MDRILDIEAASFGDDAWDRELFLEALAECSSLFLLAKLNGRLAGYGVTCVQGSEAELISIAVFPEARRCGVGEAILRHMARKLKYRGVRRWRLMVRINNVDAIRLYQALGFRRVRTVRNYYGQRGDAWRMEWLP